MGRLEIAPQEWMAMPNQQPPKPTAGATATDDLTARALADLESPDEAVRARAAQTLVRLEHPRALEACLRTLDDAPDELHLDVTPAVHGLRTIGKPALPPLLDRLETGGEMTRRRAEQAVIWISKLYFGFD